MNTTDVIEYNVVGFSNEKYLSLQKNKILERIDQFRNGKLYLEIGGKFLYDPHGARVLPGFQPDVKLQIFRELRNISEVLFCVNAKDIASNRQLKNSSQSYTESVVEMLEKLSNELGTKPYVIVNLLGEDNREKTELFKEELKELGYSIFSRYQIGGYPTDTGKILSETGYGKDDYVETSKKLIIVIGAASNSGKMSTCLGQIYQDQQKGVDSGYAKYETFPIWSLPISHPINLAYEASTVDIGDFNLIDSYHMEAYGQRAVNYNRDVEAFKIVKTIGEKFIPSSNFMSSYKSPTDMGINCAGLAITDDEAVCVAGYEEIKRRGEWYTEMIERGDGDKEWVDKCFNLARQAHKYIEERGYNPDRKLL